MKQEFERIILPIDGSDQAKKAAKKAFFLAKTLKIPVVAIHVINQPYYSADPHVISALDVFLRDQARNYLKEIEKLGKNMNVPLQTRIFEGTPYHTIVENATKNDLIVMGNKGKTDLKRILIGSVSEKVTRHAPCPVLIVR